MLPGELFNQNTRTPPELITIPTKEILSKSTEKELQRLGDQAAEILGMYLGINLSDLEVFRSSLAHLNQQNTGKKDRLISYKATYQEIIAPQIKALAEMIQEKLNPIDWEVRIANNIQVGDMISIVIKHQTKDLVISFFERGFSIDSPDLEVSWNIFPPKINDDDFFGTYISFLQRPTPETGLAPAIRIQSEALVKGEGLIILSVTDASRAGLKPNFQEILHPKGMLINAIYSAEGELKNLRLIFTIPGKSPTMANSLVAIYDCQELHVGSNQINPQCFFRRTMEPVTLPIQPEIVVTKTTLQFSYLNQTAAFPLHTGSPVRLGKQMIAEIEKIFPAHIPFPQLNQSTG